MKLVVMYETLCVVSLFVVYPLFYSKDLVSKTPFYLSCQMRRKRVSKELEIFQESGGLFEIFSSSYSEHGKVNSLPLS